MWDISKPLQPITPRGAGAAAAIPADQLALLKSRALNISRVHICVIGADLQGWTFCVRASEHSLKISKEKQDRAEDRALRWARPAVVT